MWHQIADATGLANYVLGAIMGAFFVLSTVIRVRRKPRLELDESMFLHGVLFFGLGMGLHQLFWLLWRVSFNLGWQDVARLFTENGWLVTPAYALMALGAVRCFSVVTNVHHKLPTTYLFGAVAVWFSGFAIGLLT